MSLFTEDEIYTVSSFLSLCNKTIVKNIPTCWMKGEISNFIQAKSGHIYFTLKDDKSQVRCALFRLNQRNIKFNLEDGMEVLIQAAPTLYESRGDFQIIIKHVEPVGVGNLQLAFEQLKEKLAKKGLFDQKYKKPLPESIKTIGVVSSSIGAVIQDIIHVLNKRYPFAQILLFDSSVQGEGSSINLTKALKYADKSNKCDVVILARGGGSLEDLWSFNDETLARTIFNAKTPIISAVGHETDVTISDFVADVRAPTPSAAAMLATPDKLEILASVDNLFNKSKSLVLSSIDKSQAKLEHIKLKISSPEQSINMFSQRLDRLSSELKFSISGFISTKQSKLNKLESSIYQNNPINDIKHKKSINDLARTRLLTNVIKNIDKNKNSLLNINKRLSKSINTQIDKNKFKLSSSVSALDHLSPLNTISRGYSITTDNNGGVITSIKDVSIGQVITSKTGDGKIISKVENVEKS